MAKKKLSIEQKIEAIDNNKRLNRIADRNYQKLDNRIKKSNGDTVKLSKINKKYGYNLERAKVLGYKPDSNGHLPSIDNTNGMLLKAPKHPSIKKTLKVEKVLGNKVFRVNGKMYTAPKSEAKTYKKELKKSIKK